MYFFGRRCQNDFQIGESKEGALIGTSQSLFYFLPQESHSQPGMDSFDRQMGDRIHPSAHHFDIGEFLLQENRIYICSHADRH